MAGIKNLAVKSLSVGLLKQLMLLGRLWFGRGDKDGRYEVEVRLRLRLWFKGNDRGGYKLLEIL